MTTPTTAVAASAQPQRPARSIVATMAERYNMEPAAFEQTLMKTVMPGGNATREQIAAFLVVANEYKLNPFTRQLFGFPDKGGGVRPIVSIDGWYSMMNQHPAFDSFETEEVFDIEGKLVSCTCRLYRKDRSRPIVITEYMAECVRNTEPWKQWPIRMLRHKAVIQAARAAFSFAGIVDEDEYEREIQAIQAAQPATDRHRTPEAATAALKVKTALLVQAEPAQAAQEPPPAAEPATEALPDNPAGDDETLFAFAPAFDKWADEPIGDRSGKLAGHTWRTAAQGSVGGGREAVLQSRVEKAKAGVTRGVWPNPPERKAFWTLRKLRESAQNVEIDRQIAREGEPADDLFGGERREDPA